MLIVPSARLCTRQLFGPHTAIRSLDVQAGVPASEHARLFFFFKCSDATLALLYTFVELYIVISPFPVL